MLKQLAEQQEKKHNIVIKETETSSKDVSFIDQFLKEFTFNFSFLLPSSGGWSRIYF